MTLLSSSTDSCSVGKYFKDTIPHCYSSYSLANEEEETFEVSWQPLGEETSRKRRSVNKPRTEKEWLKLMMEEAWERGNRTNVRRKRALDPIISANSGRNRRKKKRLLSSSNPKSYVINDNALLSNGRIQSCLERWRHQTALELRGFPYWGSISLYSGGGYVANLGYDTVTAYTVISDLHSNGWIDVQTRAAFVEFTVYNANTNLFGIVSILVEFPASSAALTRAQYQAARLYLHLNFGQTLSHIMVIFFMLYFFYREARLVYKQRWAYFKGFWNWVETILVFCEFSTIILFLARLYEVDQNLLQLRENPNDYVGFQYAASADTALSYVLGVLVFFYTLRFVRLLRFNKNFLVIGKTLARISTPILNFCVPFFFGFLAFCLFAFSVFGSELLDYSTFTMTMVTQFSMTLGDFDFEALVMVNPLLGPLYFFGFIGLNVFILMNMFLAIINDSYSEIQEEEKDVENEYEVLDYVVEKLQTALNVKQKQAKVSPKKLKQKPAVKPQYVSFRKPRKKRTLSSTDDGFSWKLGSCETQLDRLLDIIEEGVKGEFKQENKFVAVPEEKRNDPYFRVMLLMESIPFEAKESDETESEENEEFEEQ